MRPIAAHCYFGLGTLYRNINNPEQARKNLTIATKMYRDMDMGYWLKQCEARPDLFQQMKPHRVE
jgi:hypothetical protein